MAGAVAMAGLPPLAGFFGKLMVLQVLAEEAALAWSVILGGSFLMVVGFARAGSMLFWRPHDEVDPAPLTAAGPALRDGAAVALAALVLAGTVALTVAGGPVQAHLAAVAASVHAPAPTIAAHALPEVR
jgi:multicomponent K+:H+ antiporter subunit D